MSQTAVAWGPGAPARWLLQRLDWLAIAAFLVLFAYGAVLLVLGNTRDWLDLVTDDGYYYLGVVRGIVEAGSSSFLPPYETNGYQPLWTLLLVATASVFGTSERALVMQMFATSFAFVALFAWMSRRRFGFAFPAIASAAVFSGATLEGMETAMLPVFVLGFFHSRSWLAGGAFSALLFLTRLDALALVVARDAYRLVFRRQVDLRHYLVLAPVVAGYFAFNHFAFGTPVPVSGLAKSVGNVTGENIGMFYLHGKALASSLLLLATVLALAATRRMQLPFREEISILLVALVVSCAYYALRSGWLPWPWYYWAEMMVFYYVTLGGALLLADKDKPVVASAATHAVLVTCTVLAFAYALLPAVRFSSALLSRGPLAPGRVADSFAVRNLELAELVRARKLPEGTFFAMGDRGGSFGFLLGRRYRFLHTEGLVGPYAYYASMRKGEGEQFLAQAGVEYLVAERDRFLEEGDLIGVVEPVQPLSSRTGQYLLCFPKDAIVIDQSYFRYGAYSQRYVFDFARRTACPADMVARFEGLRGSYGQLRKFTLHTEYTPARNWITRTLDRVLALPTL